MVFFKNNKLCLSPIIRLGHHVKDENFSEQQFSELMDILLDIHRKVHSKLDDLVDPGPDDTMNFLTEEVKKCLEDSEMESMSFVDLLSLKTLMDKFLDKAYDTSNLEDYQCGQVLHAISNVWAEKQQEMFKQACKDFIKLKPNGSKIVSEILRALDSEDDAHDGLNACHQIIVQNRESLKALINDNKPHGAFLKPMYNFFRDYAHLSEDDEIFENFEVRLRAFAEGGKLVCEHGGKTYPDVQVDDLIYKYLEFMRDKKNHSNHWNPKQYQRALYTFKKELAALLELTPKNIQQGEAFWAWKTSDSRKKDFRPSPFKIQHQHDSYEVGVSESFVPLPLTNEQKMELLSVFHLPPPLWFSKRALWEQDALKQELITHLQTSAQKIWSIDLDHKGWDIFSKRSIPATLKWLPIVGASRHELMVNGQSYAAYRVSVPVPYDAHRATQQTLTNLNMNQINEGIPKILACPSNKNMVLVSLITGRKTEGWISYFLLGCYDYILGHYKPMKEYNPRMVNMEDKSISSAMKITHYNFGVNWFRYGKPLPISEDYLKTLKPENPFKSAIEQHNLRITRIQTFDSENRNPNLFAAALIDASERYSGGVSIGHCKSSKDRKGFELMIADAMLVYHAIHGEVPQFNDTGLARENFIQIIKKLFASGVYSDVAAFHSPGSQGLKDESILPGDIKKALGENYKNSKLMASWNKPKLGWLFEFTAFLTEPKVQFAICAVGMSLTITGILLTGPLAPMCLVGAALLISQVIAMMHQFSALSLERELNNFNPKSY